MHLIKKYSAMNLSHFSVLVKKYSVTSLFFILGIVMLIIGASSSQDATYFIASLMVLIAGFLSLLFSAGFFKSSIGKLIGYVAGLSAVICIFLSWKSVKDTSKHNELYKFSVELVKENLSVVRLAQKAYKDKFGVYAPSWDKLEEFIKTGTVPEVQAQGFVPTRKLTPEESKFIYKDNRPIDNNMTEWEAYQLSRHPNLYPEFKDFKRDTVQINFFDKQFNNATYLQRRKKLNFGEFNPDSLRYVPYTGAREKFKMQTIDSIMIGTDKVSVLEVKGKLPFAEVHGSKKREEISFGSLTLPDLSGSWE
ncbi:MAG: hypothetical protein HYU67_07290 [Flavobacteriia bacterium]|nr:hypothetical protein [Flavobacteriia bacterium]